MSRSGKVKQYPLSGPTELDRLREEMVLEQAAKAEAEAKETAAKEAAGPAGAGKETGAEEGDLARDKGRATQQSTESTGLSTEQEVREEDAKKPPELSNLVVPVSVPVEVILSFHPKILKVDKSWKMEVTVKNSTPHPRTLKVEALEFTVSPGKFAIVNVGKALNLELTLKKKKPAGHLSVHVCDKNWDPRFDFANAEECWKTLAGDPKYHLLNIDSTRRRQVAQVPGSSSPAPLPTTKLHIAPFIPACRVPSPHTVPAFFHLLSCIIALFLRLLPFDLQKFLVCSSCQFLLSSGPIVSPVGIFCRCLIQFDVHELKSFR